MEPPLFPVWLAVASELAVAFAFIFILVGLILVGKKRNDSSNPLNLLPFVIQTVKRSEDLSSALQILLEEVCRADRWDYGEIWFPNDTNKVLEYEYGWFRRKHYEEFHLLSKELRFGPNMDLAGTVWFTRQEQWVQKISTSGHPAFLRFDLAQKFGFKTALGIPVLDGNRVLAVLLLLSRNLRSEDPRVARFISTACDYVVSLVQRREAEILLDETSNLIEKRVQEKTEELTKQNKKLSSEFEQHKVRDDSLWKLFENYQSLLASIHAVVWEYDLGESRFVFVSQQSEEILGYTPEAWMTDASFWEDHIHGADREMAVGFRNQLIHNKVKGQCEYRVITSDGRARWIRDMMQVVQEGEGVKLRGMMVDITNHKMVEETLNEERNFIQAVLDTASALVVVLDPSGKIMRANPTCEEITGYKAEQVKGKFFWDLFSVPEKSESNKVIFNRLIAGQFPISSESEWYDPGKNHHVVAWSSTALLNKENEILHVIATGFEITKRKEIEQRLKEAIENLEHTNRDLDKSTRDLRSANDRLKKLDGLKSHFISAASHELKTPLTSIQGYVEAVLEEEAGPLNEQQKEFLLSVNQATDRLHRLLVELLDISKIESGQVKMKKDWTDMRNLLKEEIVFFKAGAEEKQLGLDLETEGNLREIYCDADKIKEVLDNLISNAVKYSHAGSGRVKISARNDEKGIRIDVEDNGIGIKAKDLPKVFEPFPSIERQDLEDEESTGLGLALAKKIVEAHDGEIKVRSVERQGSVFTVFLPASVAAETAPAAAAKLANNMKTSL
ncbi:MAG: PAS domain S-box protein [Candidatus Omnitrophica bacterium]|nr:PAS domain S-box protein [Candidatus Omnitrophota bacterium]